MSALGLGTATWGAGTDRDEAAKILVEYLLKGTRPASDLINVGSEIVFQSSIPIFEKSWDSSINLFM